jgi:hypothetical protein
VSAKGGNTIFGRKSQIHKFMGSFRYRKSAKFLGVPECKSGSFSLGLIANRNSANFVGLPVRLLKNLNFLLQERNIFKSLASVQPFYGKTT